MPFPTNLDDNTTIPVESTNTVLSTNHVTNHTTMRTAIIAIETLIGVTASAVTGTFNYILGEITGSDKAVGKTATQTLTNKTLTSPTLTTPVVNVGSDADGDMYYRSSGAFTRLPKSTDGKILKLTSGSPSWQDETSTVDGSYSTKGVLKGLTDAATSGLTISSGVISVNSGTSANNILKLDGSAKIPAVDGSQLTGVHLGLFSNGETTKDAADASATQTIAHGLGKTPKKVKIKLYVPLTNNAGYTTLLAEAVYNGTTQTSHSVYQNNSGGGAAYNYDNTFSLNSGTSSGSNWTRGVITVDSTNISIAWTKTGSPTGTYNLVWEAEA